MSIEPLKHCSTFVKKKNRAEKNERVDVARERGLEQVCPSVRLIAMVAITSPHDL